MIYIFFIRAHSKEHLETFLQGFNNFNSEFFKFTYESNEKEIPFLDLKAMLNEDKVSADLYIKCTERHQYLILHHNILSILRGQ